MIESDFLSLPDLHVKGHASLVWVDLNEPQKVYRKQLEFIQLEASKLTVCELVELFGCVTGGFLNAIAMEEVVSAVDPTLGTGRKQQRQGLIAPLKRISRCLLSLCQQPRFLFAELGIAAVFLYCGRSRSRAACSL